MTRHYRCPFEDFVEELCVFRKLYVRWVPSKRKPGPFEPKGHWEKCDEHHPDRMVDLNEAMVRIITALKAVDPLFVAYHVREYDLDAEYRIVPADDDGGDEDGWEPTLQ
jgi:hypothetical protein